MAVKISLDRNNPSIMTSDISPSRQIEKVMEVVDGQFDTTVASIDLKDKSIKPILDKTHLAIAAESGDLIQIELLARSCDVNELDKNGQTALAYAAQDGQVEAVKLLIKLGAQVDLFKEINNSSISGSPLMAAANNDEVEICKILLDSGANVNLLTSEDYSALYFACSTGNINTINLLIDRGADVNNGKYFTPLIAAVSNGQLQACRILLEKGADAARICPDGLTALNYAQNLKPKDYIDIIYLLKKYPGSVGTQTPLSLAAKAGDLQEIELLAKFCDIDELDKDGQTALGYAAQDGQLEAVKLLIELGAKVDLFKEPDYKEIDRLASLQLTLFNAAVKSGNQLSINSDSIVIPKASYSPLMNAAGKGHVNICQVLLDSGANVNLLTAIGYSALTHACYFGQLETCIFLLEKGADAARVDSNGATYLHYAQGLRPKKHKAIMNLLQKVNPDSTLKSKYVDIVSTLSHSLSIEGTSTFRGVESFTFDREGRFEKDNYQKFAHDIKRFCQLFPGLIPQDVEKQLRYTLQIEADSKSHREDRTNNRFLEGKPVLIESGWSGFNPHAVSALLWNEYLFICNRGAVQRKNIELFRLSKDQIEDPEIIKLIRKASDVEVFSKNIYTKIASKCHPKQTNDEILENLCSLGDQTVGNCSWASLEQSVFMFLVMSALKSDLTKLSKTEIQALVDQQKKIFKNFTGFQQLNYLEEYGQLTATHENLIESDFVKLVSVNFMFPNICHDSKLTQKVNEVFSTHFPEHHPNKLRTDALLLLIIIISSGILLHSFLQKQLSSFLQGAVEA